jgi:fatty acyl-CoA reductase
LVRIQKKIWKGYQILEYYTSRSWLFNKENLRTAQKFLNSTEKTIFKSDLENFNLKDYFTDAIRGARRYILKDKDEDVPLALKRMRV